VVDGKLCASRWAVLLRGNAQVAWVCAPGCVKTRCSIDVWSGQFQFLSRNNVVVTREIKQMRG
jgi:hypothetical protein